MAVELDETGNNAIDIAKGGTNATTIPGARANLLVIGTIQQAEVAFTEASTGLAILAMADGDKIIQTGIEIISPFSISAEITLGTSSDNDRFLDASDIFQDSAGFYYEEKLYNITVGDTMRIYLTNPGTGNGKVLIKYIKGV